MMIKDMSLWEQLVIWAGVLVVVFHRPIIRVLTRFKNVKLGPLAFEMADKVDEGSCPHSYCKDARNKTTQKIYTRIEGLERVDTTICEVLDELKGAIGRVEDRLNDLSLQFTNMQSDQLKMMFYSGESTQMPKAEKIVAGLRYVAKGGNHKVKTDTIEYCIMNRELYETIVAVLPELRLAQVDERLAERGR